jgi:DNA-binding LytR/AlgR family response regulator
MRHDRARAAAYGNGVAIDQPTALIADDEAHLRDYLETQLASVWPELHVVAKAANGIDAMRLIDELAPDIAFLDIQMPGMTGLDVAARLAGGASGPHIVFITAHDHYAVDAFEHSACDYLLKPASLERLARTVGKLKAMLRDKPAGEVDALRALLRQLGVAPAPAPAVAPLQWIRAAHGGETRLISIDEVVYFQSNDKYTSVFLQDGESLIRTPLRHLREQLSEAQFWQIHRGMIVAAKFIEATHTDFRGRLMVKLKGRSEQLVVSRNYVEQFKQM